MKRKIKSRRKNLEEEDEWMKEKFIPAEKIKWWEQLRGLKVERYWWSSQKEYCYNCQDSYTLEQICAKKHKEKMCPYHKFKVNPNCVCYNGMLWK